MKWLAAADRLAKGTPERGARALRARAPARAHAARAGAHAGRACFDPSTHFVVDLGRTRPRLHTCAFQEHCALLSCFRTQSSHAAARLSVCVRAGRRVSCSSTCAPPKRVATACSRGPG
eukprot:5130872-Pleurochrysis_carterae.AAC.1